MSLVEKMKLHAEAHVTDDPAILAKTFMPTVRKDELTPLVEGEFWRLSREETRRLEAKAVRERATRPTAVKTVAGVISGIPEELRDLLSRPYSIDGRGPKKRFGDMTADEHLARAAYQRTKADGLVRSAELHEMAARTIQTRNVTCLTDLAEAADAA